MPWSLQPQRPIRTALSSCRRAREPRPDERQRRQREKRERVCLVAVGGRAAERERVVNAGNDVIHRQRHADHAQRENQQRHRVAAHEYPPQLPGAAPRPTRTAYEHKPTNTTRAASTRPTPAAGRIGRRVAPPTGNSRRTGSAAPPGSSASGTSRSATPLPAPRRSRLPPRSASPDLHVAALALPAAPPPRSPASPAGR